METKKSILQSLADPVDSEIIRTITDKAKSVNEIISELDLSTSSTYQRLKSLEEDGIIYIERVLKGENGKPSNLYRAAFTHVNIEFSKNNTKVEIEPTSKIVKKTYKLFSGLRGR